MLSSLPGIAQALILAGGAAGALGYLWTKVVRPVWKKAQATKQLYALHGKVDCLTETLTRLEPKLNEVHHELHPNSGLSIKDQVTRIEEKLDAHLSDPNAHENG